MAVICQRNCCHDYVLQFTHVAGIIILLKFFKCFIRYHPYLFAVPGIVFLYETLCQNRYVLFPLPERWDMQIDNIKSVIQVFSQGTFFNQFFCRFIDSCDNSDVNRNIFLSADSSYIILLQHSQQLALKFIRHGTHFIQQQRTSAGLFEKPCSVNSSRESAFCRTEKNPFKKAFRKSCTVLRQKRFVFSRSSVMYALGEQFFSRAGLSRYQHGGICL